jgi:iron complex transport system permease protein
VRARAGWVLGVCGLFLAAAWVFLPFVGVEHITLGAVLADPAGQAAQVFWQLRLPRVLAGSLAGAALAAAGLAFQALFRNPLATPFTLGTASGASLGASVYLASGAAFTLAGVSGLTLCAFGGALVSLAVIYGFSRRPGGSSTETMLLAGVALGFLCSALILLLQYLSDQAHSLRVLRWLMGGLEVVGFRPVLEALPFIALGLGVVVWRRGELDLLSVGEDLAVSRGVDLDRTVLSLVLAVGLMVGAVVSFAGPIGFVGLVLPHVARRWLGPGHRRLLPAVLLMGAAFLPACDALARVVLAPAELPVGLVTALLGGPFFLWILLSRRTG